MSARFAFGERRRPFANGARLPNFKTAYACDARANHEKPERGVPARIVRTAACWTMSRMVMVSCASARGYALGLTSAMASVVTAAGEGSLVRMDQTKVLGRPLSIGGDSIRTQERRVFFAGHARLTRALLKTHVKLHCLLLAQLRGDRGRRLSSGLGGGWAWT